MSCYLNVKPVSVVSHTNESNDKMTKKNTQNTPGIFQLITRSSFSAAAKAHKFLNAYKNIA